MLRFGIRKIGMGVLWVIGAPLALGMVSTGEEAVLGELKRAVPRLEDAPAQGAVSPTLAHPKPRRAILVPRKEWLQLLEKLHPHNVTISKVRSAGPMAVSHPLEMLVAQFVASSQDLQNLQATALVPSKDASESQNLDPLQKDVQKNPDPTKKNMPMAHQPKSCKKKGTQKRMPIAEFGRMADGVAHMPAEPMPLEMVFPTTMPPATQQPGAPTAQPRRQHKRHEPSSRPRPSAPYGTMPGDTFPGDQAVGQNAADRHTKQPVEDGYKNVGDQVCQAHVSATTVGARQTDGLLPCAQTPRAADAKNAVRSRGGGRGRAHGRGRGHGAVHAQGRDGLF